MKVAVVVVVYRGLLESVQVFSDPLTARGKYEEVLEEHGQEKDSSGDSTYNITLEKDLLVH